MLRMLQPLHAVGVYGVTLWQAGESSQQLSRVADLKHEGIVRR
jgi:hypothetical protein